MSTIFNISNKLKLTNVKPLLLDLYTGSAVAYSLRSLSSITNNVVRVREDAGNTEQDFTAEEITDGTLETFVGAGNNGYVTTWYDQSGNSNDATQNTASRQPKIVDAGVLLEDNGKPAILPDGVDDILLCDNITIDYKSIFIAGKPATNVNNNILLNIGLYFAWEADKVIYRSNTFSPHSFPSDSTQSVISVIAEGGSDPRSVNAYRDGVASTSNPISLNLGQAFLRIFGSGTTGDYDNPIQELIIYPSDQSSNRESIEQKINEYYNIY